MPHRNEAACLYKRSPEWIHKAIVRMARFCRGGGVPGGCLGSVQVCEGPRWRFPLNSRPKTRGGRRGPGTLLCALTSQHLCRGGLTLAVNLQETRQTTRTLIQVELFPGDLCCCWSGLRHIKQDFPSNGVLRHMDTRHNCLPNFQEWPAHTHKTWGSIISRTLVAVSRYDSSHFHQSRMVVLQFKLLKDH